MFRFNFLNTDETDDPKSSETCEAAIEIKPSGKELEQCSDSISTCEHDLGNGVVLKTLSKEHLEISLAKDVDLDIKQAEESHSDLVAGVYEGGLKIWECTFDLCQYLMTSEYKGCLEKKAVLDLGCGAGLLGILACKLGAAFVDFQDYNTGVIKHLTIPNLLLNFPELPLSAVRFWSGDWGGFKQPSFYDFILTSETIYSSKSYAKLHKLFMNCLKKDGVIILAAKSYYFGVGGSIGEFLSFVEKENVFKFSSVWCSKEGVKREVIELRFRE